MLYISNFTVCSVEDYIFSGTIVMPFITPKTVSSIVWMLTLNFTVGSVICSIFIPVSYMVLCVLCSVSCMLSRFFVVLWGCEKGFLFCRY